MNRPHEPLDLSAPMARRVAPRLCRRDPASGEDCSWYHGLWQDLRAVGLAASPEHQAEFFLAAFKDIAARNPRPRVLVSGAADYSILAYVLWACDRNGLDAEVTVVDLCETPLHFNRWYAERTGKQIATACSDIFSYRPGMPVDVICSHSFLGRFPPEQREALAGKWRELLSPGGTVLAVNRVRPAGGAGVVTFSAEEGRVFCQTVSDRIAQAGAAFASEREEILARTRLYVERSRTYPMSTEELTALFERREFRLNVTEVVSSDPRNRDISGKGIPRNAKHACVVAVKP